MKKIVNRLKRVNGQIQSLIRMIESERDCEKVIIQFQASKAALEGAYAEMIKQSFSHCFDGDLDKKTYRLIKLLTKK